MRKTYFEHKNYSHIIDDSLSNINGMVYVSQPRTITITQKGLDFIEGNKDIEKSNPYYNSYSILKLLGDSQPHNELELQTKAKSDMDLSNWNYVMNMLKVSGLIYTN